MKVNSGGVSHVSTVDWAGKPVASVFFAGCPFRCPYCQNTPLLKTRNFVELGDIEAELKSGSFLIDGVVFTGGECTAQPEPLAKLCKYVKANLDLDVALDTNGYYSSVIKRLINAELIDRVMLDVKAPLKPQLYGIVIGRRNGSESVQRVKKTIEICQASNVEFEVRTTIVPGLIDDEKAVREIAREVKGCDTYFLQQFRPEGEVLDEKYKNVQPPSREKMMELAKAAFGKGIVDVRIRTKEFGEEKLVV